MASCVSCLEPNEYQDQAFTCGKCRNELRLFSENAPRVTTQARPETSNAISPTPAEAEWHKVGDTAEDVCWFFGLPRAIFQLRSGYHDVVHYDTKTCNLAKVGEVKKGPHGGFLVRRV